MIKSIRFLELAGCLTMFVAIIHIGCIIFGADWYRFLGAGEQMAQLSEQGHWYPTLVTSVIVCILLVWAAYAFSGARLIVKLPFLRIVLVLISLVLMIRALGFYFLMAAFPENSFEFWLISSGLCFFLGLSYIIGLTQSWHTLSADK